MSEVNVIWQPLAGSQSLALSCPCDEILYEGTRGPGKTDAQLMRFRMRVGMGYGEFWRGIILDREYKNLDDLISKSKRWFYQFGDGAKFLSSASQLKWVWPTGEELMFRQMKTEDDYNNYHGHEYPFIGWNELTKQPNPKLYEAMFSCNRSSFIPKEEQKPIPLEVFSTTNPYGPGHNWVKRWFIDPAPRGVPQRREISVFNPQTGIRETIVKHRVAIFGSYKENKYLSPQYVAELESITDENKKKAWLWGDWDIVAGGALDDVWSDSCKVPRFKVPKSWMVTRSFDWGSTHPFSVGWWAVANGEEAELPDGRIFCPPRGSLIRISEWYGSNDIGTNEGLKMPAPDIARGIKEHEQQLMDQGWIERRVMPGPADNQIFSSNRSDHDTIAEEMLREGIEWERSDKSPGSRINGLELMRSRLLESKKDYPEKPALYFMDNCAATFALLPTLPRDPKKPDDVDTEAEDHLYDEVRYMVLHVKQAEVVPKMRMY